MRKSPAASPRSGRKPSVPKVAAVPSCSEMMSRTMTAILHKTGAVLAEDGVAKVDGFDLRAPGQDAVCLHDVTAVASFGVPVGLLIAFSFDMAVLDGILDRSWALVDIPADERPLYLREAAAELVNIVLGLCTADFEIQDMAVSLSPPVVLEETRAITRRGDAVFACMEILTDQGGISVNLIGPRHLFDERLNYLH